MDVVAAGDAELARLQCGEMVRLLDHEVLRVQPRHRRVGHVHAACGAHLLHGHGAGDAVAPHVEVELDGACKGGGKGV